jgi:hypothetical protein
MNKYIASAAIAALAVTPLCAQPMPSPVQAVASPAGLLTLNSGTPVTLAVAEDVNSSTHKEGDIFKLTVLNDVKSGDTILIPRGTPATGEITWRTGKGAFGKSGKLELSLRYIDLNGQKIPVTGDYRQEGEGNTIATGVGVLAIGVFAGFITGKRARLPVGRELMSQVAQAVPFTDAGVLAPSYDSSVAMAAAEANTPLGKCKAKAATLPPKKQEKAVKNCFVKRMD